MLKNCIGRPYSDERWPGGPQIIPGKVFCACYDLGGEGVAFHDTTGVNQGSGKLNPLDGAYLNEFRKNEAVDTSYTKPGGIDDSPYNRVQPEMGMLYVGWTEPGEWVNYTVDVKRTGDYSVSLLYTSRMGGAVSLSVDGRDATGPVSVESTFDAKDDVAWRQWHHWNRAEGIASVRFHKGLHVLTLNTVENGQMNYACLEFEPTT
jgi:hypothetical protein